MEPITLTTIAAFLSPFLIKAGEKVSEKTVEALFDSREDIAEKYTGLFKDEILTLGLNESSTAEEITKQLQANPEVKEEIRKKIETNQDLLNELVTALQLKDRGISINAEKIAQVNINSTVTLNIENF